MEKQSIVNKQDSNQSKSTFDNNPQIKMPLSDHLSNEKKANDLQNLEDICPFCKLVYPIDQITEHMNVCQYLSSSDYYFIQDAVQCPFCKELYQKDSFTYHILKKCPKSNKVDQQFSMQETLCYLCQKQILITNYRMHIYKHYLTKQSVSIQNRINSQRQQKQMQKLSNEQKDEIKKLIFNEENMKVNCMSDDELFRYFSDIELQEFQQKHGIESQQINKMIKKKKFDQSTNTKDNQQCMICQEEIKQNEDIRELCCSHQFHVACIDEWLSRNAVCPICRESLLKEDCQFSFDQMSGQQLSLHLINQKVDYEEKKNSQKCTQTEQEDPIEPCNQQKKYREIHSEQVISKHELIDPLIKDEQQMKIASCFCSPFEKTNLSQSESNKSNQNQYIKWPAKLKEVELKSSNSNQFIHISPDQFKREELLQTQKEQIVSSNPDNSQNELERKQSKSNSILGYFKVATSYIFKK